MPERGESQPAGSDRPVVRVKPHTHKPSKAELEEGIQLRPGTTREDRARAAVTPVTVVEE